MSFVWFLILVGALITVHEAGHFFAARLFHIGVVKVSVGFGPPLFEVRRGGTLYSLGAIPLGGYVRLFGEEARSVEPAQRARAFAHRPAWQRLLVIFAGPAANLALTLLLFVQLFARQTTAVSPTLGTVFGGQPAAAADLRPGDRVIAVDDEPIRYWQQLNERVLAAPGQELRITIERPGVTEPLTKYLTPRAHLRTDPLGVRQTVGLIGISSRHRPPQIAVLKGSPAFVAGLRTFDVITAVQGHAVRSSADLAPLLAPRSGSALQVSYLHATDEPWGFASTMLLAPGATQVVPAPLAGAGHSSHYDAGIRSAELMIHDVEAGSPAAELGLTTGDTLLDIDGQTLTCWEELADLLDEDPLRTHRVRWRGPDDAVHDGGFLLAPTRARDEYQSESTRYVFGARGMHASESAPEVAIAPRFGPAVTAAIGHAFGMTITLARAVGLTISGRLPATTIGGPILVYQVAGRRRAARPARFLGPDRAPVAQRRPLEPVAAPASRRGAGLRRRAGADSRAAVVDALSRRRDLHRHLAAAGALAPGHAQRSAARVVDMIVLGLDTSTLTASVALCVCVCDDAGERVLASHADVAQKHSDTLLLLVDRCLRGAGVARAALDVIAVGAGPGSFTGLRIGLATAKGLCFALDRPLVLVSSLAALAARAPSGRVVALTDAHKAEVYAGRFWQTATRIPSPYPPATEDHETVRPPAALAHRIARAGRRDRGRPLALVGDGLRRYPELRVEGAIVVDEAPPRGIEIARLGAAQFAVRGADPLGESRPHYIRLSEAEILRGLRARNGL